MDGRTSWEVLYRYVRTFAFTESDSTLTLAASDGAHIRGSVDTLYLGLYFRGPLWKEHRRYFV